MLLDSFLQAVNMFTHAVAPIIYSPAQATKKAYGVVGVVEGLRSVLVSAFQSAHIARQIQIKEVVLFAHVN